MAAVTAQKLDVESVNVEDSMEILFRKLDEAIDDMDHGRVQTIEEAWKEIDAI